MTPGVAQRDPKGSPKGAKVDFLKHLWATGAHDGPPEAHMVPFGKGLCSFLLEFGHSFDVFWIIWEQPWDHSH